MTTARHPVFNHIAMSVDAELVEPRGREELLAFYGEVFGWTAMPGMAKDGELLVLRVHSNEQFVFLVADEDPMTCPSGDHVGLSTATPEELYEVLAKARKFAEKDDRVEIIEPTVEDYKVLTLHNFYVRYRLPLSIELQCYDWAAGVGPESLPSD